MIDLGMQRYALLALASAAHFGTAPFFGATERHGHAHEHEAMAHDHAITMRIFRTCIIAIAISGCGDRAPDRAQLAAGERIYAQHCAACHGAKLEGQPNWRLRLPSGRMPAPPHDESGHTWHHTDNVLFGITKQGLTPPYAPSGYESDMPAFAGTLTDDEIRAVLAYIKSHWTSPEVLAARAEMTQSGAKR